MKNKILEVITLLGLLYTNYGNVFLSDGQLLNTYSSYSPLNVTQVFERKDYPSSSK